MRQLPEPPQQERLPQSIEHTRWTPIKFLRTVKGKHYWLMKCKCGNEKEVCLSNYKTGKSLSCGCYRRELWAYEASQGKRYPGRLLPGESAKNQLMLIYKRGAKKRNFSFELTKDQFLSLTSGNCHYCGSSPQLIINPAKYRGKGNGAYVYNGIDRKDSNVGYVFENCVTACRACNYAKGRLTYNEFIEWLNNLIKFRNKKAKGEKQK